MLESYCGTIGDVDVDNGGCSVCARVGTCVEVLVAVVLVLDLVLVPAFRSCCCWGWGPWGAPGDPKIAVRRFFTNLFHQSNPSDRIGDGSWGPG